MATQSGLSEGSVRDIRTGIRYPSRQEIGLLSRALPRLRGHKALTDMTIKLWEEADQARFDKKAEERVKKVQAMSGHTTSGPASGIRHQANGKSNGKTNGSGLMPALPKPEARSPKPSFGGSPIIEIEVDDGPITETVLTPLPPPKKASIDVHIQSAPPSSPLIVETTTKDPYTRVETITPDLAKVLLEGNVRNRQVSQNHVDAIARDILAGHWKLTHQGIAIDTEGRVLDGQHRLHAVIKANKSIRLSVTYNADPESYKVVDTGSRLRTTTDILTMAEKSGESPIKTHINYKNGSIAAVKILYTLSTGTWKAKWTSGETIDLLNKYPEVIRATDMVQTGMFRLTRCSASAGIAYVLPVEDPALVADFVKKITSRVDMTPVHAAYLRTYEATRGGDLQNLVMAALTIRTIHNLKKGLAPGKIYMKDPTSYDPLTDEYVRHYRALREKKGFPV